MVAADWGSIAAQRRKASAHGFARRLKPTRRTILMNKRLVVLTGALALTLSYGSVLAKAPPEEAARLGKDLTPVGAERGASKDGTIPEWQPAQRRGALSGEYPNEPRIDGEKPLFTITKANMAQYADKLSEGHKHLLNTYDSYKMNVYPSHRFVTWPNEIFEATKINATNCELLRTRRTTASSAFRSRSRRPAPSRSGITRSSGAARR
jgi:hypothetical protein